MQMASNTRTHTEAHINADVFALVKSQALIIAEQQQPIDSLKHQLEWFKRQMFGVKSERFMLDNPAQLTLGSGDAAAGQTT